MKHTDAKHGAAKHADAKPQRCRPLRIPRNRCCEDAGREGRCAARQACCPRPCSAVAEKTGKKAAKAQAEKLEIKFSAASTPKTGSRSSSC